MGVTVIDFMQESTITRQNLPCFSQILARLLLVALLMLLIAFVFAPSGSTLLLLSTFLVKLFACFAICVLICYFVEPEFPLSFA